MKHLSAVEVLYMASELQSLIGSRLGQVYQPSKDSLFLQFHVQGKGRATLKVRVPYAAHMASEREPAASPAGFCSMLRKSLNNSTLSSISQAGFERILQLNFSSKNGLFSLFLELFSKGNIILAHEGKILAAQHKQAWGTRTIATGEQYKLPPSASDPRSLDDKQLLQMLKGTNKTDVVRFLAIELSLGGLYAEELCLLAEIDKKTAPADITEAGAKKLLQSLKELLNSKLSPSVIYESGAPIDAVPISLSCYKNNEKKPFKSFSSAIESLPESAADRKPSSYEAEIARLKTIVEKQQEIVTSAKNSAEKSSRSGELIYEHYQEVKDILDAFKSGGWAAVKELQKRSKTIKSIDEKTGKIIVDL